MASRSSCISPCEATDDSRFSGHAVVEPVKACVARARPVIEHVSDRHVVGDAESEVQVGEAVANVHGERAHGSSGNDAPILLREP